MKATANRTNFGPILGYEIGGWVLLSIIVGYQHQVYEE
jgi:hypothetical protein